MVALTDTTSYRVHVFNSFCHLLVPRETSLDPFHSDRTYEAHFEFKRISISERPNYAHVVQNKSCCKVLNKPEIDGYLQYGDHHI